jgi:hypothetical protein
VSPLCFLLSALVAPSLCSLLVPLLCHCALSGFITLLCSSLCSPGSLCSLRSLSALIGALLFMLYCVLYFRLPLLCLVRLTGSLVVPGCRLCGALVALCLCSLVLSIMPVRLVRLTGLAVSWPAEALLRLYQALFALSQIYCVLLCLICALIVASSLPEPSVSRLSHRLWCFTGSWLGALLYCLCPLCLVVLLCLY